MAAADLPHSSESERALLASVLLRPDWLEEVEVRSEDFFSRAHAQIWDAMVATVAAGKGLDLVNLQAHLEEQGLLGTVGGVAYLAGLDVDLPDFTRASDYAATVRERATRRRLVEEGERLRRQALGTDLTTPELLDRSARTFRDLADGATPAAYRTAREVLGETLDELEERQPGALLGLSTGLPDLDRLTQGLRAGHLVIVAGRTGMGKTALALNLARTAALDAERPVAIASLEMSRHELAIRLLSIESGVPARHLEAGWVAREQWRRVHEAERRLGRAPLHIDDASGVSVGDVCARARRLHRDVELSVLVVDYVQLLVARNRGQNRHLELGVASRELKRLARDLGICVLLLSQLSRRTEDRNQGRPQLSDLRESGNLEEDADRVIFVYRPQVYLPDDPQHRNRAELIVAKNRHGETGSAFCGWEGPTTRFLPDPPGEAPF